MSWPAVNSLPPTLKERFSLDDLNDAKVRDVVKLLHVLREHGGDYGFSAQFLPELSADFAVEELGAAWTCRPR